jgi:hypothetical protein
MVARRTPEEASLLDILIDGFEKNEILGGFHWRDLPLPDAALAIEKFESLVAEARRWKGEPSRLEIRANRRQAAWTDLEIRQSGRGIRVLVKAPRFDDWWNDPLTWIGDPMGGVRGWTEDE